MNGLVGRPPAKSPFSVERATEQWPRSCEFLLADEPVSMLDVSIRASILNLLQKLNEEMGITIMFVSHDLSLINQVCDRAGIMYLGRIIERGETDAVIQSPTHPYSKALITAAPEPDPFRDKDETEIEGGIPDPVNLPQGCRFKERCPERTEVCDHISPPLLQTEGSKYVAYNEYYDENTKAEFQQELQELKAKESTGELGGNA